MLKVVTALGAIAVMMISTVSAFAEESQQQQPRTIVAFLLENACSQADKLAEQMPDAYVYCTHDASVMMARSHLSEFEKMYHVVYVDNNQSWGITMHDYSYSLARPWSVEIRHESEHLACKCFYTPDNMHGSPHTGTISGVIVN